MNNLRSVNDLGELTSIESLDLTCKTTALPLAATGNVTWTNVVEAKSRKGIQVELLPRTFSPIVKLQRHRLFTYCSCRRLCPLAHEVRF